MNEFIITLICIGSFAILLGGTWGITSLVYHLIDRRDAKRWVEAKRKYPEINLLLKKKELYWRRYDDMSDVAVGYKKQIDALLCNLTYLPAYEKEWREQQAEVYKEMWYSAQSNASVEYDNYLEYHKALEEFCKAHKLKRME
jgi:hypothetical protein